jgi:UDP-N-acetylmuramoylalanine--D-glutamate ligase
MTEFKGKHIVILGAARQGTALARYLVAQGARVTLSDTNASVDLTGFQDLSGLRFALGGHPLSLLDGADAAVPAQQGGSRGIGCDVLCLSGGVPADLPIVLEAKKRGIPLSNDAQIFMDICPAPVIGITGSAGKTTTTTLVGEMLKLRIENEELRKDDSQLSTLNSEFSIQKSVWVGGNIGNPLISDIERIEPGDIVVMELSSFQLELMTHSPHIACITNITPNHLDRHGTMQAYIAAKRRILDFQTAGDWQILSADDAITRTLNTTARTLWFSIQGEPHGDGAWMNEHGDLRIRLTGDDGRRTTDDQPALSHPERSRRAKGPSSIVNRRSSVDDVICHRRELQLMGEHNILNVLAASATCAAAGASVEAMRSVATTFKGVPHRLQLVAEIDGARYYDDSIATAPERLIAALQCFDQPVILLCGGRDKHLPWAEAARLMLERCKHIVLFGEMGPMVAQELRMKNEELRKAGRILNSQFSILNSLDEAVEVARGIATSGDVVLLSPGGTSYDAFKDFAERGNRFQALVNQSQTQTWSTTRP